LDLLAGVTLAADQGSNGRGRGHKDRHPSTTTPGDPSPAQAPEIDVASGIEALALLAGGLIVIRGRRQASQA